jgi:hypothetical protein
VARRTIAEFERYEDAEALVDRLAQQGFPVDHVVIVGRDLQLVEQVTGMVAGRYEVMVDEALADEALADEALADEAHRLISGRTSQSA